MKSKPLFGLGVAACIALSGLSALAQDAAVPDHKLSEFTLGKHVSGEEVDLSKLEGQVVAIEYWGTR
jgi:hypothetical protein